jgi:hypothetical protein
MRATEFLTEAAKTAQTAQTASDGSKLIWKSGSVWLWEVPKSTYLSVYDKDKADLFTPALAVPAGVTKIYYVSMIEIDRYDHAANKTISVALTPDQAVNQHPSYYRFLTTQGDQLITLAGRDRFSPTILKKLAQITGAQHAPDLDARDFKDHVLYQGQVTPTKAMWSSYVQPPLTDGSQVWQIPKSLFWTLARPKWTNSKPWNTEWLINNSLVGNIQLLAQDDHIVKANYPQTKATKANQLIHELVNRENLTLGVDLPEPVVQKPKTVKSHSVMHQMLEYVAANPGGSRSDWFIKHMGYHPSGMPGWTDSKAHDGVAASMGWIRNEGTGSKFSLHITPVGKVVLARLNAGHPVKLSRQI